MKNLILLCIFFLCSISINEAQEFSLIQDLNPGSGDGYFSDAELYQDEIYFLSFISSLEIYKVGKDLKINKVIGFPDIFGAEDLTFAENSIYFSGFDPDFEEGIIRYDLTTNTKEFLIKVDESIEQRFSLNKGVVYVEENEATLDKKIHYFEKGKAPMTIVANINLGFWGVDVTEIGKYIIISPFNDDDYEGGVIVFNKETRQLDNSLFENICSEPRYAYGFENVLIYSCDDNYYAYDMNSVSTQELDINGLESLKNNVFGNNYIENDDYIFLYPQSEDNLFALRKSDLLLEELSHNVTSIVDLYNESGYIYFTEGENFSDNKIFKCDGTFFGKEEIHFTGETARVSHGAILMDKTHLVVSYDEDTGFTKEFIAFIEEDNLVNIREIFQGAEKSIFKTLGSAIVLTSDEPEVGLEFFSLEYPLSTIEPIVQREIFSPSLSQDEILHSISNQKVSFDLFDTTGQLIGNYKRMSSVQLPYTGIFYIKGELENGKRFVQKVIKI